MPPISLKKVVVVIAIVVLLSRLDRVLALLSRTYLAIYNSLEPLRNSPTDGKFLVTLGLFALAFVVIWSFLQKGK